MKKLDRLAAGANYADTVNRSVKQLHRDLPKEVAAKRADLTALSEEATRLQGALEKAKARVAKLEAMEERSAKEEKRLATYTARLEKRLVALREAEAKVQEDQVRNDRRTKTIVQVQAEQDARHASQEAEEAALQQHAADVAAATTRTAQDLAALEAVTQEMEEDTVRRSD